MGQSTTNYELKHVRPEDLDKFWPHVKGFFEKGLKHSNGDYSVDDIYTFVDDTEWMLWVMAGKDIPCAFVSTVSVYPGQSILEIIWLGGENMDLWGDQLIEAFEKEAKANDCSAIAVNGRDGWERYLKRYGFEKSHVSMRKQVWST